MDHAARLMLIAGTLLAAGVLSSRLSARSGVPLALLFVAVGLFAGEEGPLGLPFDDARLASGISVGLLALILFDGGLGTPAHQIRRAAGPAILLATVGVVVTALIVGASAVALGFSWIEGLLLGSILGSTDAAAVFAAFRGRGTTLPARLRTTLEVESGLNDPIAIFLTIALTGALIGEHQAPSWWTMTLAFGRQMSIGTAIGVGTGFAASRVMRNLHLEISGLYLVLSLATALLAFGASQVAGGSGAIGVYAAGVVLGQARLPFGRGIRRFHDGLAWIAQVAVFVLLGLLALPSGLAAEAPHGLAIALVLVLVARPVAVFLSTSLFRFDWRDQLVLACGGLRGAVPVVLATIPLAAGVPGAGRLFNLVFFAVLLSVGVQGIGLAPLARRLGREELATGEPPVSLELTALRETGQELLGYRVEVDSVAAERPIRDLPLPLDALITLVVRRAEVIAPRGSTVLAAGDQVYVLHQAGSSRAVEAAFSTVAPDEAVLAGSAETPLPLDARLATVGDFRDFYGLAIGTDPGQLLAERLAEQLPGPAHPGDHLDLPGVRLTVLSVQEGHPHRISVEIRTVEEV